MKQQSSTYIKLEFIVSNQDGQSDQKEKLDIKTSKVMKQATLASLYGNNFTRQTSSFNNNSMTPKCDGSDDCIIVEKDRSFHSRRAFQSPLSKLEEEEEKFHGNTSGTKRIHKEMKGLCNDNTEIRLDEEASQHISGNGFVTAKVKLVIICICRSCLSTCVWVLPLQNESFRDHAYVLWLIDSLFPSSILSEYK